MSVRRKVYEGQFSHIPDPTFSESLLMEILIQVIDSNASDEYVRKSLLRAGFTEAEADERLR